MKGTHLLRAQLGRMSQLVVPNIPRDPPSVGLLRPAVVDQSGDRGIGDAAVDQSDDQGMGDAAVDQSDDQAIGDAAIPDAKGAVNVAQFKAVQATDLSTASDPTAITDGQSNTSAELRFLDVPGRYATVTVDLSGSHLITMVVVAWAPGTTDGYARKFVVMATDDVSPGMPDPNSSQGAWTTIAQKEYASGDPGAFGTQNLVVPVRPARWIALILFEDGGVGPTEVFQLAEFQAYVQ